MARNAQAKRPYLMAHPIGEGNKRRRLFAVATFIILVGLIGYAGTHR